MFDIGTILIVIGKLDEILDDKGTTAHPLRYTLLDSTTYEVEMSLTNIDRPMLHDHIAWTIPVLSAFESTRIVTLKGGWQLQKVLLAVTEVLAAKTKDTPGGKWSSYPRLKGCAKQIPLNEEERFLCDIHGIKYV